uniref:EXPERA domain-containing protein n=1 Tax=Oryza glumipatula TaxID=40148 RepID=A0A0D9Y228_9ORYZ
MGHPHPHPYAPAELHLPGFVPLQLSQAQILVPYLATSLFLLLAVWLISGRCSRRLSDTDRWLMCWWAFTGLTHIIIEGTFVFAPNFFSNQNPSYFDEVWKEYSKGDSRYVARDPATVTVEGITAVLEGPASLLAVGVSLPLPPSPLPYLMRGSRQKCRDREEEVEDGGVASSHSVAPRGKLLSCSASERGCVWYLSLAATHLHRRYGLDPAIPELAVACPRAQCGVLESDEERGAAWMERRPRFGHGRDEEPTSEAVGDRRKMRQLG